MKIFKALNNAMVVAKLQAKEKQIQELSAQRIKIQNKAKAANEEYAELRRQAYSAGVRVDKLV